MDTCICMVESLHSSPETITILSITYTPKQNKKFFFLFCFFFLKTLIPNVMVFGNGALGEGLGLDEVMRVQPS